MDLDTSCSSHGQKDFIILAPGYPGQNRYEYFFIEFIQVVPRYNVCKSKPTICTKMHGLVVATGQLIRHHWYLEPMVLNFFAYCNNAL